MRRRSIGNPVPVIAHAPSGFRFVVAYAASSLTASRSSCSIDGEQIMRDGRGLRRLRVGVRGEHRLAVLAGEVEQRPAQPRDSLEHAEDHLPLLHPVHRHVDVVARPRRVQPARGLLAAGLHDEPLDVEEQVLARAVVGRAPNVGDGTDPSASRIAAASARDTIPHSASITRCA